MSEAWDRITEKLFEPRPVHENKSRMKSIHNECLPPLSREEEITLFRAYQKSGDRAAQERLCRANFPLVIKLAGRFASNDIDVEELISQGLFKLVICIENFDLKQSCRFSTYLTRAIVFCFLRARSAERRHQSGRVDPDSITDLEDLAVANDTRETDELLADLEAVVESGRAGLSRLEYLALTMAFWGDGRTPIEIGLELGLSRKVVVGLIESGVVKLREVMRR